MATKAALEARKRLMAEKMKDPEYLKMSYDVSKKLKFKSYSEEEEFERY